MNYETKCLIYGHLCAKVLFSDEIWSYNESRRGIITETAWYLDQTLQNFFFDMFLKCDSLFWEK